MLIIAGLGNPGAKFAGHRHNIGFMAVDEIVRSHGLSPWRKKFKAEISDGLLGGESVLLMKPQTYMNESGQAVGEAMRFYNLGPEDVVVLYDELDLAPGKVRIKTGGGSGGHNGIKSIDAHCGKDYRRVRLGIGHPGHKDRVTGYVLGDFAKADRDWLDPLIEAIGSNADLLASGQDSTFMNRLAIATGTQDDTPPKPVKQPKPAKPAATSDTKQAPMAKSGPMADMLKKLLNKGSDS